MFEQTVHQSGILLIEKLGKTPVLKSIFYFKEAEDSLEPVSLTNTTWEAVKAYIQDHRAFITSSFQ